jgi:hypothetical protein
VHQYALKGHTAIHSSRLATSPIRPVGHGVHFNVPFGAGPESESESGLRPRGESRKDSKDSNVSIHVVTESPMEEEGEEQGVGLGVGIDERVDARRFKSFRGRTGEMTGGGRGEDGSYGFEHGNDGRGIGSQGGKVDDPLRSTTTATTSASSKHGLSGLISSFGTSSGPDLRLHFGKRSISKDKMPHSTDHADDGRRGGAHRGTRDYPHLRKDDVTEREERTGLVGGNGGGSRDSESDDDDVGVVASPMSGTSMDIIGSYTERDDGEKTPTMDPPTVLRRLPEVPGRR